MSAFNAQEYWRDKPVKKWVVTLEKQRGGRVVEMDKLIVSARSEISAKRTAAANSMMNATHYGSCMLATPNDLGCRPDDECVWCDGGTAYSVKAGRNLTCNRCNGTGKREVAA